MIGFLSQLPRILHISDLHTKIKSKIFNTDEFQATVIEFYHTPIQKSHVLITDAADVCVLHNHLHIA